MAEVIARAFQGWSTGLNKGLELGEKAFGKFLKGDDVQAKFVSGGLAPGEAPLAAQDPELLSLAPAWAQWPDYQRLEVLNGLIAKLWPQLSRGVAAQVKAEVAPALAQVVRQQGRGYLVALSLDLLDLGDVPPRLDGIKVFDAALTREDEMICEARVAWGSALTVRVAATLRIPGGGGELYIPVTVRNVAVNASVRVRAFPALPEPPFFGQIAISLLAPPHVQFELPVGQRADIMSLPGVNLALRTAVRMAVSKVLLYPKALHMDLTANGGLVPGPVGLLQVRLLRISNLKNTGLLTVNPYAMLQIRQGRAVRTRTVKSDANPVFDETFALVVDDLDAQSLRLLVRDDEVAWTDSDLGVAELPLSALRSAAGRPGCKVEFKMDLYKPVRREDESEEPGGLEALPGASLVSGGKRMLGRGMGSAGGAVADLSGSSASESSTAPSGALSPGPVRGTAFLEAVFIPFDTRNPRTDASARAAVAKPSEEELKATKGVLSVCLLRAAHLGSGADTEHNAYVKLRLYDPVEDKRAEQTSSVAKNEKTPRWKEAFDFAVVTASSTLEVTVWEKAGALKSATSLKSRGGDKVLGKLNLAVMDVAREGRVRNTWPLGASQHGEIELALEFFPARLLSPEGASSA